jgi:glutamine synthetase
MSSYNPATYRPVIPPCLHYSVPSSYLANTCTYRKASAAGIYFFVGFESEFILLKSTKPVEASRSYPSWLSVDALLSGTVESKVIKEIADNIQAAGIGLQTYHGESAPGQVITIGTL